MVGELVLDNLPVPSDDDRVGQVSHHKVRCFYADPTAQMLEIISELTLRTIQGCTVKRPKFDILLGENIFFL